MDSRKAKELAAQVNNALSGQRALTTVDRSTSGL